jgi:hypothetical protein
MAQTFLHTEACKSAEVDRQNPPDSFRGSWKPEQFCLTELRNGPLFVKRMPCAIRKPPSALTARYFSALLSSCGITLSLSHRGARVRGRVRSCGIWCEQSGTGAGFFQVLRVPLPIFIPAVAPQSPPSIIWGWYNTPVTAAVPSGLSLPGLTSLRVIISSP